MTVTPELRLYALGATLWVALTICLLNSADRGGPYFLVSSAVAGIVYLLAVREVFARPRFPRRVVVIGLLLAAVWHVQFLQAPPGADDDIHRYVWDGRLQRLGYDPYVVVPDDPAVKRLHTPDTINLNNPDLASPYPAGAQIFFRAVTAIRESTFALRVAFVICEAATVFVLLALRRRGQGAHVVLAYAWNPLLAIEVAGSGHVDVVGALLLVISAAALARAWRTTAAVAFALAVSVKVLPIVLLPLYWRRVRIRDGALAAAIVGLLYVPFLDHGRISIGSLGTYVQRFRFNDPVFAALERLAPPQLVAGLALLAGFLTAAWMRRTAASEAPAGAFAWPMAASLLCAPVVYPWYLMWLMPFLTSASTLPITVWTASILPTYVVWHLRTLGRPWVVPGWVTLIEYGVAAMAGAVIALRLRRPATRYGAAGSSETTSIHLIEEERP